MIAAMRILAGCVLACLAATAHADPEADKLFEQGRKLLATDPAAACAKFDEAIKRDPDAPGVLLNLGLCNEKTGKYKTALYWFRKAQSRSAESNLPAYVQAASEHQVNLAKWVARVNIQFTEPSSPMFPPFLLKACRTSATVRTRLSVMVSTRMAVPPGP